MKRTSFWKKASILLALVVTLSLSVVGLTSAAADGVTVGAFENGGIGVNGSSENALENRTVLTTAGGWNRATVTVSGFTGDMSIELSLTANEQTVMQLSFFKITDVWNAVGANVTATLEAGVAYEANIALAGYIDAFAGETTMMLGFYFDTSEASGGKKVTVNTLTVGGVSYTPATYVPEEPDVPAPEKSFKAHTEWNATNATVSANTLESMPSTDDRYETAVSDGMGNITISDTTQKVTIEIPLSESLTAWPKAYWSNLYVKLKTEGVSKILGYVESENELNAFCNDFFGNAGNSWQCVVSKSVSEGYRSINIVANHASDATAKFFENYLKNNESITKIVLVPVFEAGAATASIEIAGMTFGSKQPVFINDAVAPELEIGDWVATNAAYVLTKDATVTVGDVDYTGLKVVYSQSVQNETLYAPVSNFDAKKFPKLRIGYYADTAGKLMVANNWTALKTVDTVVGYNVIDLDVSDQTAIEYLRFYLEANIPDTFDNPRTLLFDTIQFYTPFEILKEDISTDNANVFQFVDTSDETLKWTVTNTDGGYWKITLPVENWHAFNRYITLDIEFDTAIGFGFYFYGKGNSDTSGSYLYCVDFGAGRYKMCFDTATKTGAIDGGENSIYFYFDASKGNDLTKTVIVHSIDFSEDGFVSSPNANVVTLNYADETVTFGAEYEASLTSDFATLLTSGAAVVPGGKLYLRLANAASEYTEITLPVRPTLDKADITAPTVQDTFIRFGAAGFQYKLGDGEWRNSGFFDKLTPGTEYTVYVRRSATANAFASGEVEYKVTTTGGGQVSKPANKGCKSSVDFVTVGIISGIALMCGASMFIKKREN